VALAALHALSREGALAPETVASAIVRLGIDPEAPAAWTV
jgi:pyruvate dehydrogenase complex dehydrogenase (E1) component